MTGAYVDDLDAGLREALAAVAAVGTLLVACDVDGTLAPIVDHPSDAVPDVDALKALTALAALPRTTVALVSGRPLLDLRTMTALGPEILLVGSHGAEHGDYVSVPPARALVLEQVLRDVRVIADGVPGVLLEEKADRRRGARAQREPRGCRTGHLRGGRGPVLAPGVRTTHGKEVVELSVVDADKGRALDRLRADTGADAVVYAGDDVTDEWAFARLDAPDVSIKVGPGETGARFRVAATGSMLPLLRLLVDARTDVTAR